jgi:hypothetical protein
MAAKLHDTIRMSRYYNGPVSDHFDGARFFDPHGAPPRSRRDLLRWFVDRHWRATKSKWPAWAPSPYADSAGAHRWRGLAHFLCRPCQLAHSDCRFQYLARPGVVEACVAFPLCRSATGQRSGHRFCRLTADRCCAGIARPLRSSRSHYSVAVGSRASRTRHYAARQ